LDLPYSLAALAGVRDETAEELARITTANVRAVLNLATWNPA
jgi:Tat protein secretion system quality control protein TatD with DNase activity